LPFFLFSLASLRLFLLEEELTPFGGRHVKGCRLSYCIQLSLETTILFRHSIEFHPSFNNIHNGLLCGNRGLSYLFQDVQKDGQSNTE
jgi:hypothetical protein